MSNAASTPTEHQEQEQFVNMVRIVYPKLGKLLFAIPNGGHRHVLTAKKLKAEGVTAGVPDLFFAHPVAPYNGLFIEMKRRKGGVVSQLQKEMIEELKKEGYCVAVCCGSDEAFDTFRNYITSMEQ